MTFQVFITASARRYAKKLPKEARKEAVNLCEEYITKHPFDSEKLQAPLNECRSLHFKINSVHYRIAYRIVKDKKRIDVLLIGPREGFYQRLRRVLRV